MRFPRPKIIFNVIRKSLGILFAVYGFLLLIRPDIYDFGMESYMKMILGFSLMVIGLILLFYKIFEV